MNVKGYGIDVSHHQGDIDWSKVAKSGITSADNLPVSFVIMKCIYESKSHGTDECFEKNYKGASENGLSIGVYVFHGSESLKDPAAEAKALVKTLGGRKLDIGIWHDLEASSLKAAGNPAINAMLKIEDEIYKAAGYNDIGIYCNKYWYDSVLDTKYLKTVYKYWWIARYLKDDKGTIPGLSMSPYKYADAWQFSSKGSVSGIKGNVDLDIDYTGLAAAMSGDIPKDTSGPITSNDLGIKTVVVNNKLNVRKTPKIADNIIGNIPNRTKVNVVEISGPWAKIEGWVSTKFLK